MKCIREETFASRIYQDYHWTSDDVLGAAIGAFVAEWVVNQHEANDHRVELSSIYPITIKILLK